ncbi:SDR family oxidoreductase [Tessaracoccus sp. Z1128]
MIDYTGKVALVTGAARGIGRATALLLAEAGAKVLVTDLEQPLANLTYSTSGRSALTATADDIRAAGGVATAMTADVRDLPSLSLAVSHAMDLWGRLDTVVANAGVASWPPSTWEASDEQWDTMLGVVLTGSWNTVRAAVPALRAGGRGGAIVMIGSTAAVKPLATIGHYAAAKSGLVGLCKSLALELAADNIRVTVVHPGGTATHMTQNPAAEAWQSSFGGAGSLALPMPITRLDPEDVGRAVRWLGSEEARYITGTELVVDGGATL